MAPAKAKIRHVFGHTFSCRAAPPDILVELSDLTPLTPYLWQRLKVVTASQAQFWARGGFHSPLDAMLIFFAVIFFCQWEWFWWIFWDFYDLFKDVQVIHYILGLGKERKINKVLKMSTIERFLMRNTSLNYLKFCILITGIWKQLNVESWNCLLVYFISLNYKNRVLKGY